MTKLTEFFFSHFKQISANDQKTGVSTNWCSTVCIMLFAAALNMCILNNHDQPGTQFPTARICCRKGKYWRT